MPIEPDEIESLITTALQVVESLPDHLGAALADTVVELRAAVNASDSRAHHRGPVVADLAVASCRLARQWSTGADRLDDLTASPPTLARGVPQAEPRRGLGIGRPAGPRGRVLRRGATRFPPYWRAPSSGRVLRLTRHVGQLTRRYPPSARAVAWLDHPVAAPHPSSGRAQQDRGQRVVDAAAGMVTVLERS